MGHSDLHTESSRLMSVSRYAGGGQMSLFEHPGQLHFFGDRFFKGDSLEHGAQPLMLKQIHGKRLICLKDDDPGLNPGPWEGDGWVTNRRACFIAVATADCVPLLLFDPHRKVIAALHAGWRGTVLNIAAEGVLKMVSDFGSAPEDILSGIGPSIGPCCFEVKEDVLQAIEAQSPHREAVIQKTGAQSWSCDLPKLNRMQLIDAGLLPEHIFLSKRCTSCFPEHYYSFRRDKKKLGNMISGIMLR